MSLLLLAALAMASDDPAKPLSPASLRATVEKLAAFNTRNTSSPELMQAADWLAEQYRAIPGMSVESMKYMVHRGPRVPEDKEVVEVVASLPPNLPPQPGIILMGGHLDSINMTPGADVLKSRAPGANDDLSGVSATLDVARMMAGEARSHPTVFVAFSGEEQGLLGSEALASRAAAEKWPIEAVLSNDIIGSSGNLLGQVDKRHVRVFSEEKPTHQSRELARYIEWLVRTQGPRGFAVKLVFRSDRFGRGGDHTSFNNHGFTAVRIVECNEEYTRQHTPNDLPEFVDFDYLSHTAGVNALVVKTLAKAAPAPTAVRVDRRQSHDARLTWNGQPGVRYIVYWRLTTDPTWTHWKEVGSVSDAKFEKLSKDDNTFAVGAVGGIPVIAN